MTAGKHHDGQIQDSNHSQNEKSWQQRYKEDKQQSTVSVDGIGLK